MRIRTRGSEGYQAAVLGLAGVLASANVSCTNHPHRGAFPMWQPFNEEHEQFRKTVRAFAEKELAPHVEEWERDELFPNWVFKRAGELGILGAHYPEEHGGAGLDYWFSVAKAEELPHCRMAGVSMGLLVQSDMATPVI